MASIFSSLVGMLSGMKRGERDDSSEWEEEEGPGGGASEVPEQSPTTAAQWREMLELLSFRPVQNVQKVRTKSWSLWEGEPVELSFDEVPPLGTFAELEFLAADE
ncbi:MAG: hypothetical protein II515_09450, partial [Desulfovibrio sp.]|nr:hypothetical protein [Desulfovibrio sp.]